ncbi:hypothetical protein EES45_34035 [Streptomyces sp. ADI97-07]|nr:hypothetical protein [Streptomyces sp. ADI97-07]RPK71754.1 hypothetical protein EES45_34035 [Streptomyces sp. ADI97-07]
MAVLLCSADTAAGQASLIVKSGPSAYGTPRAVPTGRGPLLVVQCPGGRLYVAVSVSDEVLVLDPDGAGRGRVRVGWAPGAIAVSPDGRSAVVCERGAGSAAVLDLSALVGTGGVQVADRVVLGSAHVQPRAVAL